MEILDQIFENPQNIQRNLQRWGFFKNIIHLCLAVVTAIEITMNFKGDENHGNL